MSLIPYKQKRSAKRTPEPFGGKPSGKELVFVVQKHAASHLHYDFRLEMEGVLKSWAVPKGPSMDPSVKRLAMMVEDHPFDYRTFEGIIPEGEYGGGTVIVWDEGVYTPEEELDTKQERERHVRAGLDAGNLKFRLEGTKLKGSFALVRTPAMGKNAWLLIKHDDAFARTEPITDEDRSVLSGLNLEEMRSSFSDHPSGKSEAEPKIRKKQARKSTKRIPGAPSDLMPMLATLSEDIPSGSDWLFEVKWDGYRAMCAGDASGVKLYSRNGKSFNERFAPIVAAMKQWEASFVVDGEIVVAKEDGSTDFAALQNWQEPSDGALVYEVFDILWYDGQDLRNFPLSERKQLLKKYLPDLPSVLISEAFKVSGEQFFSQAVRLGLEGIMAKRSDSTYQDARRTDDWLKIKVGKRQEMIICGYTRNSGTSKPFSALLLGVFDKGRMQYAGKVGTGFSRKSQEELLDLFRRYERKRSPFAALPDWNQSTRFHQADKHTTVIWLKPVLVCEVSFTERTAEGVLRHPSFKGLREDKAAGEVHWETPRVSASPGARRTGTTTVLPTIADTDSFTIKADKKSVELTNLQKVYWPDSGITKGNLLAYYRDVAPYILPFLRDRPLSLNRFPNGINGKHFYQKDMTDHAPSWAELYAYQSAGDAQDKHFILGNNLATILFIANLGCIEMHPWSSRVQHADYPDWCVIDLDPGDNPFVQVVEAAQVTHKILTAVDCPCYCKTSGASGLHIYIPLGAKYTYEQSREFAHIIVNLVQAELPAFTTLERSVAARKGKMYLDFLQNRAQATLAAPYSVRPEPGASVSMPLYWEEVNQQLRVSDYTIANACDIIKDRVGLFAPVLGKGIAMQGVLQRLATVFGK
jgi:bifunctional non-homologous end joining protein LigD